MGSGDAIVSDTDPTAHISSQSTFLVRLDFAASSSLPRKHAFVLLALIP